MKVYRPTQDSHFGGAMAVLKTNRKMLCCLLLILYFASVAFRVAGSVDWNSLSLDIRSATT